MLVSFVCSRNHEIEIKQLEALNLVNPMIKIKVP
jgi:hypothetical protein